MPYESRANASAPVTAVSNLHRDGATKFDIQKAVDYVLDQQNSRQLRAIELFALLVALHVGRSRVKVSGRKAYRPQNEANLVLDVSERQLRAAKMLAAMKMLDQLEMDWVAENDGREPRWSGWPSSKNI